MSFLTASHSCWDETLWLISGPIDVVAAAELRSHSSTLIHCCPLAYLKGSRHIVAKDTPTANLLLALAHVGGAEIDSLPASTGRVDL